MTNQDTDEPQAIARNGNIIITGWDAEYTPEAARAFIGDLAIAYHEALRQLAAIIEACADGHTWNGGYNSPVGDKHTVYHCTREGCQGLKEEPGWLPFEPKQHIVPFSPTLRDCTGPGCDHCDEERFADAFNRSLASATKKLNDEFLPLLGDKAAGLKFDTTPILEARKIGYEWTIDATPAQVQAALNAREASKPEPTLAEAIQEALGPGAGARAVDEWWASRPTYDGPRGVIPAVEARNRDAQIKLGWADDEDKRLAESWRILGLPDPADTTYVIGSCGCGHPALNHTSIGCEAAIGPQSTRCDCDKTLSQLAAKISGIGTEDTTP